jgi:osmotically-inducible protein OsmY
MCEGRWRRRWSDTPAREASRIDLTFGAGERLTAVGTVHSFREKQAVLGAIQRTRGVREVSDHLRVEPKA